MNSLLRYEKQITRFCITTQIISSLIAIAFLVMKYSLGLMHEQDNILSIQAIQLCICFIQCYVRSIHIAFFKGRISVWDEIIRQQNCRIVEITGMPNPILVRPDDPRDKQ